MSELVVATRERLAVSEGLRVAVLAGLTTMLGAAFLLLLVADQAQAAGL